MFKRLIWEENIIMYSTALQHGFDNKSLPVFLFKKAIIWDDQSGVFMLKAFHG